MRLKTDLSNKYEDERLSKIVIVMSGGCSNFVIQGVWDMFLNLTVINIPSEPCSKTRPQPSGPHLGLTVEGCGKIGELKSCQSRFKNSTRLLGFNTIP